MSTMFEMRWGSAGKWKPMYPANVQRLQRHMEEFDTMRDAKIFVNPPESSSFCAPLKYVLDEVTGTAGPVWQFKHIRENFTRLHVREAPTGGAKVFEVECIYERSGTNRSVRVEFTNMAGVTESFVMSTAYRFTYGGIMVEIRNLKDIPSTVDIQIIARGTRKRSCDIAFSPAWVARPDKPTRRLTVKTFPHQLKLTAMGFRVTTV